MLTFAIENKSNNIMDTIIFEGLKSAYERANEIGETELAKDIYKLTYDNIDWWERDEDEYNTIFSN